MIRPKTASLAIKKNNYGLFKLNNEKFSEPDKDDTINAARMAKISNRAPPKGLLLKQRKLLLAAKNNSYAQVVNSGFTFSETDVNVKDDKGNTPLYYGAKYGNLELCQFLLDQHARVNEPCENDNTPLHVAFASDKEMVYKIKLII